jgi:hypothetical protein
MEEQNQKEVSRLKKEIDSVQSRFFHLLSITSVVMMVLAVGFVLRIVPKVIWNLESLETERYYIPQLLGGPFLSGRAAVLVCAASTAIAEECAKTANFRAHSPRNRGNGWQWSIRSLKCTTAAT